MLSENSRTAQSLRRIVGRLTADPVLQEDLMQEGLIRMWRLRQEAPGRTKSWYLQNCRFYLQHWLASGRSVDSLKRAGGDKRVSFDEVAEDLAEDWCHTNGELLEMVSARDLVSTLACHLNPLENEVLGDLASGLALGDIAVKLNVSYPTALKCRRRIAALTTRLGIAPPLPFQRGDAKVETRG